jgi:hypothetical protein
VDARTGRTAWTDSDSQDRRGFGAIVAAGSCLLCLPSSAELIAFEPNEKQCVELGRAKVAETPTYAHPVVAGQRLYIKDQETVMLYTVPQ